MHFAWPMQRLMYWLGVSGQMWKEPDLRECWSNNMCRRCLGCLDPMARWGLCHCSPGDMIVWAGTHKQSPVSGLEPSWNWNYRVVCWRMYSVSDQWYALLHKKMCIFITFHWFDSNKISLSFIRINHCNQIMWFYIKLTKWNREKYQKEWPFHLVWGPCSQTFE